MVTERVDNDNLSENNLQYTMTQNLKIPFGVEMLLLKVTNVHKITQIINIRSSLVFIRWSSEVPLGLYTKIINFYIST